MESFIRILAMLAVFAFVIYLFYSKTNGDLEERYDECAQIETPVVSEPSVSEEILSVEPQSLEN